MIPRLKEKISDLPEGMTEEKLEKALNHNFLALSRIFAQVIKIDIESEVEEVQRPSPVDGREGVGGNGKSLGIR